MSTRFARVATVSAHFTAADIDDGEARRRVVDRTTLMLVRFLYVLDAKATFLGLP